MYITSCSELLDFILKASTNTSRSTHVIREVANIAPLGLVARAVEDEGFDGCGAQMEKCLFSNSL
jgi:hypothetical protein